MTDKETIIDGVDVSGCRQYMHRYMEDYDIDTLDYCRYHFKPCKDVDVKYCYYKQLKRKEQECEKLKKDLHQNFKEKDKLHLIIDRLLEASGYDTNTASAEDFEDVYENMRYEKQQLEKLGQALTKIKEIAEKEVKYFPDGNIFARPEIKQILQKISEVENE